MDDPGAGNTAAMPGVPRSSVCTSKKRQGGVEEGRRAPRQVTRRLACTFVAWLIGCQATPAGGGADAQPASSAAQSAVAVSAPPVAPSSAGSVAPPPGSYRLASGSTIRLPDSATLADHEVEIPQNPAVEQHVFRVADHMMMLVQFRGDMSCTAFVAERKRSIAALGRARVTEERKVAGHLALYVEIEPHQVPTRDGEKFTSAMARISFCEGGDRVEALIADDQGKLPADARKTLEALVVSYVPAR